MLRVLGKGGRSRHQMASVLSPMRRRRKSGQTTGEGTRVKAAPLPTRVPSVQAGGWRGIWCCTPPSMPAPTKGASSPLQGGVRQRGEGSFGQTSRR